MPLIAKGVYADCGDMAFEIETTYYLNFQILSSLVSLERLDLYDDRFWWENRFQYYHYYCDHLLFSIGQISNRFIITSRDRNHTIKERKRFNSTNYQFVEHVFPILSDKRARNMMEHIDEHNQSIIESHHGVGGFNLIDTETDSDLANDLRSRRDTHPYTLDLVRRELLLRWKNDDVTISLEKLRDELLALQSNVKSFAKIISGF